MFLLQYDMVQTTLLYLLLCLCFRLSQQLQQARQELKQLVQARVAALAPEAEAEARAAVQALKDNVSGWHCCQQHAMAYSCDLGACGVHWMSRVVSAFELPVPQSCRWQSSGAILGNVLLAAS
jgi:hypothetical protein